MTLRLFFCTAALIALGCSAIVNPDPTRLGGAIDGGTTDAGPRRDAAPPDGGGDCPAGCDDSVACTIDSCVGGRCVRTPDDGACAGTDRCSPVLGCVAERCSTDLECDDARACTGIERCDVEATSGSGCLAGQPMECDDQASCTADSCDDDAGGCVYEPIAGACDDGISCTTDACAPSVTAEPSGCIRSPDDALCDTGFCFEGGRCDVNEGCVGGTAMVCDSEDVCQVGICNDAEQRCDFEPLDADNDGYGPSRTATGIRCGDDCDDGNANFSPDAEEICDGFDNDCDESVDEGCAPPPDDCDEAQALEVGPSGEVEVSGILGDLDDDYRPGEICQPGIGGRDAVYYIDIPSGTWDVKFETTGSAANTILALSAECTAAGFRLLCNDDANRPAGSHARMWLHRITGPIRFYVMVDGYDASQTGAYTLNVQREPAHADGCPVGGSAPMSISGGGTILGVQSSITGTQRGSCQRADEIGGEAVFVLETQAGPLDLRALSSDFVPDIYVRRGNCQSGNEVACTSGSPLGGGVGGAFLRESVDAGGHTVILDGGRGNYALEYRPY